jgi:hypothetical protein
MYVLPLKAQQVALDAGGSSAPVLAVFHGLSYQPFTHVVFCSLLLPLVVSCHLSCYCICRFMVAAQVLQYSHVQQQNTQAA